MSTVFCTITANATKSMYLIWVAVAPVDFRAGLDGLVAACRQRRQAGPFSGALFVFGNRTRKAIKVLVYDGQVFWMCHKRLSGGHFAFWPDSSTNQPGGGCALQACRLQVLLMGGDPARANAAPDWQLHHDHDHYRRQHEAGAGHERRRYRQPAGHTHGTQQQCTSPHLHQAQPEDLPAHAPQT